MQKIKQYFLSHSALKISVLEREMKNLQGAYPVGTLKLFLNPNQGKAFPAKWLWLLCRVLEPYGGLQIKGSIYTADQKPDIFLEERAADKEDTEEWIEEEGRFLYSRAIYKEAWDLDDFVQQVLTEK